MTPDDAPGPEVHTCIATAPDRRPPRWEVDPALSGLSLLRVLRSELQKLCWMRATWWLAGTALVLVLLWSWVSAVSLRSTLERGQDGSGGEPSPAVLRTLALETPLTGLLLAVILLAGVGVLAITSEHATGSLRSSLAAVPRRTLLYTAKALAVTLVVGVLAAVLIAAILAVAVPAAAAHGLAPDFTAADTWHRLLAHWAGVVLAGILGYGLGAVLRSTAGGVVALALVLFVLPLALEVLIGVTDGSALVTTLSSWQFGSLMGSLADPGPRRGDQVGSAAAALGLLAWTGTATVAGGLLFRRRDA